MIPFLFHFQYAILMMMMTRKVTTKITTLMIVIFHAVCQVLQIKSLVFHWTWRFGKPEILTSDSSEAARTRWAHRWRHCRSVDFVLHRPSTHTDTSTVYFFHRIYYLLLCLFLNKQSFLCICSGVFFSTLSLSPLILCLVKINGWSANGSHWKGSLPLSTTSKWVLR